MKNNILYEIAVMNSSHYEEVYQLWLSCEGMGLNEVDDAREGISRYLKRNPSTCFVALANQKVVGVILSGHDGRRGFIYHTAVASDCRKQGIATALLKEVMTALRKEGIIKVSLVAFQHNDIGNAFWETQGFYKREDLYYRDKRVSEELTYVK